MTPGSPVPHEGVVYRSRGAVLVIGDSATVATAACELVRRAPKLHVALFAPGVGALSDLPPHITAVGGRVVALQGHLGQFSASVRIAADQVEDAGIFSANADRRFDLVLDLCREPLLRRSAPPLGYYAPGGDAAALLRALDSLPQLTGDFHQPKYVDYRPALCAHGAMGIAGCTRCLDVCATAAIRSVGEKIEVDPWLCQGCASCTLACPSGALGFRQPPPKVLQGMLDHRLTECAVDAGPPVLVVHETASRHLRPVIDEASGVVLFEVNRLPAFSDVLCLTALARGVSGVVLVVAAETPPESRKLIERKLSELRSILVGSGGDPVALQFTTDIDVATAVEQIKSRARSPVSATVVSGDAADQKRANLLDLIDALTRRAQASGPVKGSVAESVALEAGAAFGNVQVDPEKCTLCLACSHLCPSDALSGQMAPAPALYFRESLCTQCDLCRAGCPEQAICLQPRFLPDAARRTAAREIASDQLVPCASCGTPFTGRRKLAVSLALMQEHAPDMPGGIDSLRMCPGCRQRETLMQ